MICPTCDGRGEVQHRDQNAIPYWESCGACGGHGCTISEEQEAEDAAPSGNVCIVCNDPATCSCDNCDCPLCDGCIQHVDSPFGQTSQCQLGGCSAIFDAKWKVRS